MAGRPTEDIARERRIIHRELSRITGLLEHIEDFSPSDKFGITLGDCDWRAESVEIDVIERELREVSLPIDRVTF